MSARPKRDPGIPLAPTEAMKGEWLVRASCTEVEPEMFFAPDDTPDEAIALSICASCRVLDNCRAACDDLERYVSQKYLYGIWGGERPRDRRARRRAEKMNARVARTVGAE